MTEKGSANLLRPYQIAFPDYPVKDCPDIPEGWIDVSYEPFTCPSWRVGGMTICVGFADPERREVSDGPRFLVINVSTSEDVEVFASDDWSAIRNFVANRA